MIVQNAETSADKNGKRQKGAAGRKKMPERKQPGGKAKAQKNAGSHGTGRRKPGVPKRYGGGNLREKPNPKLKSRDSAARGSQRG